MLALLALLPLQENYRVLPNLAYLGPKRGVKLDAYIPPPKADGTLSSGIVWIHGGGWVGGDKGLERDQEVCRTLASHGYVVLSVDYRLGDNAWPLNIQDCKNAVRYLRTNAAKAHLDPNKIAVAGGSAGGHLALMVGLTTGVQALEPSGPYPGVSSAVKCVIDLYGPAELEVADRNDLPYMQASMRKYGRAFGATSLSDPVFQAASPIHYIRNGAPPLMILHGTADVIVDVQEAKDLEKSYQDAGNHCEAVYVEGVGHAFDLEKSGTRPLPQDLRPTALNFLARFLDRD